MASPIRNEVRDSNGVSFCPDEAAHVLTHDGNGNVLTDTATVQNVVRVRTMTYAQDGDVWVMVTQSQWINQSQAAPV